MWNSLQPARLLCPLMGFPRQEYWSGVPFPPQGDLPDPGMKPMYPAFAGRFFTTEPPGKPYCQISYTFIHSKLINTVSCLLFLCSCLKLGQEKC